MGIIDLFKRKQKNREADEDTKRTQAISSDSSDWASNIEFLYFPTDEELKNYLIADLIGSPAEQILVVGGVSLFEGFDPVIFSDHEFLVNDRMSLSWLCTICQQIRDSNSKHILVTNFPREANPPKVRFVETPWYIAKADGDIAGTVREISAPADTSLNLCELDDAKTKLAIYFVYVNASSYYKSVLVAQGCPPKTPVACKVLSSSNDNGLLYNERAKLKSIESPSEQRAIMIKASEELEALCLSNEAYKEKAHYSGGILGP